MSQVDRPRLPGPDPIAAQRDDGTLSTDENISSYEYGPQKLHGTVAGRTPEQLGAGPVEGRWSTLEVVCHLADSEQFFADRLKRTIGTDRPLLLGAQGGRYPEPLFYHDRELDEEPDLIALTRRQMARTLRLAPEAAWGRTAVHSETGLVTLRQLVPHPVRHQEHHLRFVDEKRRALGAPEAEGAGRRRTPRPWPSPGSGSPPGTPTTSAASRRATPSAPSWPRPTS